MLASTPSTREKASIKSQVWSRPRPIWAHEGPLRKLPRKQNKPNGPKCVRAQRSSLDPVFFFPRTFPSGCSRGPRAWRVTTRGEGGEAQRRSRIAAHAKVGRAHQHCSHGPAGVQGGTQRRLAVPQPPKCRSTAKPLHCEKHRPLRWAPGAFRVAFVGYSRPHTLRAVRGHHSHETSVHPVLM